MNPMVQVDKTIYDRLTDDAGLGCLFGNPSLVQGVYATAAPSSAMPTTDRDSLPIITFSHTAEAIKTDDTDGWEVTVLVEVVGSRDKGSADSLGVIMDRVHGDVASSGTPTYGLQRWEPANANGYTFAPMDFESWATAHDDTYYVLQTVWTLHIWQEHSES